MFKPSRSSENFSPIDAIRTSTHRQWRKNLDTMTSIREPIPLLLLMLAAYAMYFPRSDQGFSNTDYRASVIVTVAVSNSSAGLFAAGAVITSFSGLLVGAVSRMFRRHMRSQKRLQWVQVCTIYPSISSLTVWNYTIKRRPLGHWTIRARFSSGVTSHTLAPAFFGKLRQTAGTSLTTFLFAQDNDFPASDLPGLPAPETSHSGRLNRPRSRCCRIRLGRPRRHRRFCGTCWVSSRCKLRYGKMKTPRWNPSIHLGESQAAEFRTVLKRLRALFAVDKMLGLAVEGLFVGHRMIYSDS